MNEQQKFMTMIGEGGPCLIYPQHMKEKKELNEMTKNEIFIGVLKPFYDISEENVASINNILQGVLTGGDFLAGIDSLMNKSQGSNQSTNNLTINTYPFGVETDETFHDFIAICRTPDKLSNVFEKISAWCTKAEVEHPKGESKHVLLITDQWNPTDFQPHEKEFRRWAMHEDFWFIFIFVINNALYDISFLPHEFYKFTRHVTDSIKVDNWIDNKNIPNKNISLKEPFEGLAEINVSPVYPNHSHYILSISDSEKYCVTVGAYRGKNNIKAAIAMGKWDNERGAYSALSQVPQPFTFESKGDPRVIIKRLSEKNDKDTLIEAYKIEMNNFKK